MRPLRIALFATAVLALGALPAQETVDPDGIPLDDPHGLAGLWAIDVDFGDVSLVDGVEVHGMRSRIEQQLLNAGLELAEGPDQAELILDVLLVLTDGGTVLGELTLSCHQLVTPVRDETILADAATWSGHSVFIVVANTNTVRTMMASASDQLVSNFLAAHREANGRRPPAEDEPTLLQRLLPFI